MRPLAAYKTLVFDCDGVVLNSNQLKIQAYHDVAIKFGASETQAQLLVAHHVKLGGISRYPKFEYFLREIMKQAVTEEAINRLLSSFTVEVKRLLMDCEVAPDLTRLRQATPDANWMIISGGDQAELRDIFEQRKLGNLFDGGVFGSPDNKDQILTREIARNNLVKPALFIGDSRYDYQASTQAGLDFVFLSDWTDVDGWQSFCAEHNIQVLNHLGDLIAD
jgi:phosphoglycolate phosphatase-like HAD superfamily hydrolase